MINYAKFIRNLLVSYGAMVITSLISFVSIPMSLHYFGKDLYGVFSLASDTITYLALANFGIPAASGAIFAKMPNKLYQELLIKRSFILLLMASGLILLLGTVVVTYIPNWGIVFGKIPPQILTISLKFIIITAIFFFLRLPLTLFSQLIIFVNYAFIIKLSDMLISIGTLISLIIVIYLKLTLIEFAILSGTIFLLANLLITLAFFIIWRRNEVGTIVKDNASSSSLEEVSHRFIFSSGFYCLLNSIANLFIFNSDNFIISHYLGVGEVVKYALIFKLFLIMISMITQISYILNPIYAKLYVIKDIKNLNLIFKVHSEIFPLIGGICFIALYGFFKEFIWLWTHNLSVFAGYLTIIAFGAYCYILFTSLVCQYIITSLNYSNKVYKVYLLEALVNIVLSILLVKYIGIAGAAFGTFISHLVTSFILNPLILNKVTQGIFKFNFLYVAKNSCYALFPCILILGIINNISLIWQIKLLITITVSLLYLVISYLGLSLETRNFIFKSFNLKKQL